MWQMLATDNVSNMSNVYLECVLFDISLIEESFINIYVTDGIRYLCCLFAM
jgi:hypothetical protein